ncbi:MAG: hypothetical protein R2798_04725 [Chitinophagales bacterium]|nr:hypothetical protein [Bacteroidota bacterium]MCB9042782.1 hypothetical protein [Chitinophagales bacterium]
MKIRIKGNSLRYRLTQSDIATIGAAGFLEEKTTFANKTFYYRLESTNDDRISADFVGDKIIVKMPQTMIDEWLTTERVTFADESGTVSILLEKDFACLDNTDEDQSDNYPNPNKTC